MLSRVRRGSVSWIYVRLSTKYHWQKLIGTRQHLYALTKRGEKFEWMAERDNAFETLKDKLVTAPILAMSQDTGDYTLDVDASNWAVGAVLQLEQDGLLCVIGYAFKTFTPNEQRYCITRRELAGMIFDLKHYKELNTLCSVSDRRSFRLIPTG